MSLAVSSFGCEHFENVVQLKFEVRIVPFGTLRLNATCEDKVQRTTQSDSLRIVNYSGASVVPRVCNYQNKSNRVCMTSILYTLIKRDLPCVKNRCCHMMSMRDWEWQSRSLGEPDVDKKQNKDTASTEITL